jgi:putative FmdB family regulatory protein
MPLYEYQCDACGHRFELIRRFSDVPVESCPNCQGGPVRRLQSAPAIQFKGSGFYITDYARQGGDSAKAEKSQDTKSDGAAATAGDSTDKKTDSAKKEPAPKPAASATPSSGAKD